MNENHNRKYSMRESLLMTRFGWEKLSCLRKMKRTFRS
nr:MAG TPA: hypothetical protein [Caudoviricetes sp.]